MNKRNSTQLISGLFHCANLANSANLANCANLAMRACSLLALGIAVTLAGLKAQAMSQEVSVPLGQLGSPKIELVIPDAAIGSGTSLPVIFLVSGFQTAQALAPIMKDACGNNIVVIFKYPLDDKANWLSWSNPQDSKDANSIATIPLQIVGVLNWIRGNSLLMQYGVSADIHRVNTVAISLGIFFLPSALRLDQMQGRTENSIVFAYAGAKLNLVAKGQINSNGLGGLAQILNPAADLITAPFEPTNYVKDLKADHFLIMNADNDQIFPKESQDALVEATPQPREVISIPGVHIGLNQPGRVAASLTTLKNWLASKGAVNP